ILDETRLNYVSFFRDRRLVLRIKTEFRGYWGRDEYRLAVSKPAQTLTQILANLARDASRTVRDAAVTALQVIEKALSNQLYSGHVDVFEVGYQQQQQQQQQQQAAGTAAATTTATAPEPGI
ncbi:MAG: hypothetical protein ABI833_19045, partial [Acidobacteriota bacterium]